MGNTHNPIIVVDDDEDDLELITLAYQQLNLPNKLITFSKPTEVIDYLSGDQEAPFLILSDINMPIINGIELRRKILNEVTDHNKGIPFLLWSTSPSTTQVKGAYDTLTQGFFLKPHSFDGIVRNLRLIHEYWTSSIHPKTT